MLLFITILTSHLINQIVELPVFIQVDGFVFSFVCGSPSPQLACLGSRSLSFQPDHNTTAPLLPAFFPSPLPPLCALPDSTLTSHVSPAHCKEKMSRTLLLSGLGWTVAAAATVTNHPPSALTLPLLPADNRRLDENSDNPSERDAYGMCTQPTR